MIVLVYALASIHRATLKKKMHRKRTRVHCRSIDYNSHYNFKVLKIKLPLLAKKLKVSRFAIYKIFGAAENKPGQSPVVT
jgi:hypothetical protein